MGARLRAIVSLCMIALGLFQAISGLVLFFTQHGPRSGSMLLFGLTKRVLIYYHEYVGLMIIAVAVLHFTLNWRMFVKELKALVRLKKS
jgi:hypothetical protein